jgi:RHS repeat-associated protein
MGVCEEDQVYDPVDYPGCFYNTNCVQGTWSGGSGVPTPTPTATSTITPTPTASPTPTPSPPAPSQIDKELGAACGAPGNPSCAEPITIGIGNVFETIADYETAGPNQLDFTRYYNSQGFPATFASTLGANWRSTYDRYLRLTMSGSEVTGVAIERADGRALNFTPNDGNWISDSDVDFKLVQTGSTWTLTDRNDSVETYSDLGNGETQLISIRARNGYLQTLQYNSDNQLAMVTDSYNRALQFTYQNNLLNTVTTPDGLVLTYGYDSSGKILGVLDRLASVSFSTNPQTSQAYLYENPALPFALTGIMDEDGNRFTTWAYDPLNRAISSQHAGGADLTTLAYNDSDGSRTVTNTLGGQEVYKFTTLQGVPKVTEIDRLATATTAAASRFFTYDANGYTASSTDWNGNITAYVNDAHGQPTSITEAFGTPAQRTTTTTYLSNFHLPAQIGAPGLTTNFSYDGSGNLLGKTEVDTTPAANPSRTWTYIWSNSLLASEQEPRTDAIELTQFGYDPNGGLASITNALGQVTHIVNTPGGLPLTIIDLNGVKTTLGYDARLRLHTSTVATAKGNLTTTFDHDAAGNLTRVTQPDGSSLANSYDAAHRLIGTYNLLGESTAYTLDALGDRKLTTISNSSGVQFQRADTFDALGRMLTDTGGAGEVTVYAYDSNGNQLKITDGLGRTTQNSFNALNRKVKIIDPANGVTQTSYDPQDRPVGVTDPNGHTTQYSYNGFGDVLATVSPDAGTTTTSFDLDSNPVKSVDAAGVVTIRSFDALNRIVATTYPGNASENVSYAYDQASGVFGVGRLTTLQDAAGTVDYVYDERGNRISETRSQIFNALHFVVGDTFITEYAYDAASRLAGIAYPSGLTTLYARDAMGQVTGITATLPGSTKASLIASNITHKPFGPVSGLVYGNGIAETRSFDLAYRETARVSALKRSTLENLVYGYNNADDVVAITDKGVTGNTQAFGYDALDRLSSAAGAYGAFGWTYDNLGNRRTQTLTKYGRPTVTTYGYPNPNNQLTSITTPNTAAQSVLYTPSGNIGSITPKYQPATTYAYNQARRLSQVKQGTRSLVMNNYDAFGRRLVKSSNGETIFQYDPAGLLLEEDPHTGPTADHIYLDGTPIGQVQIAPRTSQIYFVHDDRLGTPQIVTSSLQVVAWKATYQPLGSATAIGGAIKQNLRLPGQYFDAETGLHQNGFRDYNPAFGRYIESDPIGLGGGLNTYGYVKQNPLRWMDPQGLQAPLTFPGTDISSAEAQGLTIQQQRAIVEQQANAQAAKLALLVTQGGLLFVPVAGEIVEASVLFRGSVGIATLSGRLETASFYADLGSLSLDPSLLSAGTFGAGQLVNALLSAGNLTAEQALFLQVGITGVSIYAFTNTLQEFLTHNSNDAGSGCPLN